MSQSHVQSPVKGLLFFPGSGVGFCTCYYENMAWNISSLSGPEPMGTVKTRIGT